MKITGKSAVKFIRSVPNFCCKLLKLIPKKVKGACGISKLCKQNYVKCYLKSVNKLQVGDKNLVFLV